MCVRTAVWAYEVQGPELDCFESIRTVGVEQIVLQGPRKILGDQVREDIANEV
jgi:hypothetical protein